MSYWDQVPHGAGEGMSDGVTVVLIVIELAILVSVLAWG